MVSSGSERDPLSRPASPDVAESTDEPDESTQPAEQSAEPAGEGTPTQSAEPAGDGAPDIRVRRHHRNGDPVDPDLAKYEAERPPHHE